jgi:hypothetical protein
LGLTLGVILYITTITIIIHYYYYTLLLLYIIISSIISSFLSSFQSFWSIFSSLLFFCLYYTLLQFSPPLLFWSIFLSNHSSSHPNTPLISSQYSFYTCRYLHILIYILFRSSQYPKYLTPHKLSEGCLEWCSFEVCGILFELVFWFWFDVRCYIVLLLLLYITIIIHILLLYYILYYPLLLFSSLPFSSSFLSPLIYLLFSSQSYSSSSIPLLYSFYTCRYLHILIYIILIYTLLFLLWSYLLFFLFLPSQYSFYTCRYLHILIYTILFLSSQSFPPQYSSFQISDPARSIGVDGWGVMCLSVSVLVYVLGFDPAQIIGGMSRVV